METKPNKRILVIEDEQSFLDMLRLRLELEGFEVVAKSDALEGLETIRRIHPDLIVLDLKLPQNGSAGISEDSPMDRNYGHKICRMVKFDQKLRKIPILILSCSDSSDDVNLALRCGADGYLMKTKGMDALVFEIKKRLYGNNVLSEITAESVLENSTLSSL
jgi:DNA-binding response OmpR family regulator